MRLWDGLWWVGLLAAFPCEFAETILLRVGRCRIGNLTYRNGYLRINHYRNFLPTGTGWYDDSTEISIWDRETALVWADANIRSAT